MIKKIVAVVVIVWCYNHPDKVSDSMVKAAVGFKTGVEASHKPYEVKQPDGKIMLPVKTKMLLPGTDGLIDPWPDE